MAAQQLVANAAAAANAKPVVTATEDTAPAETPETTPEAPVAEVEATSVVEAAPEAETAEVPEAPEAEEAEDGADSDVLSPKSSLDPKTKERIQRRIDKVVAKAKATETAAQTRIAELEARLNQIAPPQQQQQVAPVPVGTGPLANITDPMQLMQVEQQAKDAIRFAEDLLETPKAWQTRVDDAGDTVKFTTVNGPDGKPQEWTEDSLRKVRRMARVTLEDQIPQRKQFLMARHQASQRAAKEFAFLGDKSSPEYQMAQAIRRQNPWLESHPNADEIIGIQIEGLKAIEARKKAATVAAEKPKTKPAPPKPSSDQAAVSTTGAPSRAPVANGVKQAIAAEQKKVAEKRGLTAEDAKASLLRLSQLRNSR
jgi:hypothetical protein